MNKKQRRWRNRIIVALVIFAVALVVEETGVLATLFGTPGDVYASFALFLIPYLIAGYKTLLEAARNIRRGDPFDEAFLMSVASLGAFAMVFFPETDPHMAEGAAVMLFQCQRRYIRFREFYQIRYFLQNSLRRFRILDDYVTFVFK